MFTGISNNVTWIGNFGNPESSGFGFVAIVKGIANGGDAIVVSYRGTDSFEGWISDAKFFQTQLPIGPGGVNVHEGFLNITLDLNPQVLGLVKTSRSICPSCSFLVTGHSLGASLSTLGAIYLAKYYPNIRLDILNFGSPRIGNPSWAEWISTFPFPNIQTHTRVTR